MPREHGGTKQYRFHLQYYFVLGIFLSNIILLSRCTCATQSFLLALPIDIRSKNHQDNKESGNV
jgi:hypothetical protein